MTEKRAPDGATASKNITKKIRDLGDWRGETLDAAANSAARKQ